MKLRIALQWSVMTVLMLQMACQNPVSGPTNGNGTPSYVKGVVKRSDNNSVVDGAIVQDTRTATAFDTTRNGGQFLLTYPLTGNYAGSVFASLKGFTNSDTVAFVLNVGATDTIGLTLLADSTSPITGPGSGKPASIVLQTSGDLSIGIRGTGSNESIALTFEVRDSLGNALTAASKVTVKFSLLGGPGGGEYVFPTTAVTNGSGTVSTRVTSGTKPGVLQLNATTSGDSVRASPVRITISSGLPDGNHFTVSTTTRNIAGGVFDNLRTSINVIVGDRFGNPVPAGTAISFQTTGGVIQPRALTDNDGTASVSLISANPRPAGGLALVTARTVGDTSVTKADSTIVRTIPVLFSGAPTQVRIFPASNPFVNSDSGSITIPYKVSDANGNPLVAGSEYKVSVSGPGSGDLSLSGDVDVKMIDTQDTSLTNFSVKLTDKTRGGAAGLVVLEIDVTSQNGNLTSTFSGIQNGNGVSGGGGSGGGIAGTPKYVVPASGYNASLSVNDGSDISNTSTQLTFTVVDSAGNPVANPINPSLAKVYVSFSISSASGLSGGESVTPIADSTNDRGQVSTVFHTGTRADIFNITATTIVSGVPVSGIASVAVTGGSPDSTRSRLLLSRVNMPGIATIGQVGSVTAQVTDKFGNPARPTTLIFGTTSGGTVQFTTPKTDASGLATGTLSGDGKVPSDAGLGGTGFGYVTFTTSGVGGVFFQKKAGFLFSGAPVVTVAAFPTDTVATISDGGFIDVNYTVADANGNPISDANTIQVSVSGAGAGEIALTNDVSIDMSGRKINAVPIAPQTVATATQFRFRASDNNVGAGNGGALLFTITVNGESGRTTKNLVGYLQAAGHLGGGGGGTGNAQSIRVVQPVGGTDIAIRGTGGTETATLIFEADDNLGNAVDQAHGSMMHFVLFPSTIDAKLSIDSVQTGSDGRAATIINSGVVAGVAQVQAYVNVGGMVYESSPIRISIHGGFPAQNHFTFGPQEFNFPGLDKFGVSMNLTVSLADTFGNAPQPSEVHFTTLIGSVSNGKVLDDLKLSDNSGFVNTTYYSDGSTPEGGNLQPTLTNGFTFIKATTQGVNQTTIKDSVKVLWTGIPVIGNFTGPANFGTLTAGAGAGPWTFTVTDRLGHPLSAGTTIDVSGTNLTVSGNANVTLPDTQVGGAGITSFTVTAADATPSSDSPVVPSLLVISVTHPIYGTYTAILSTGAVGL